MTNTRFNIGFISIVLVFMFFQVGSNYYYDHYGIYGHELSGIKPINYNQRYGKVEYLHTNKSKHNAYLLGSSRLGNFNSEVLSAKASEALGKDLNFYNLSVFSGVPSDYLSFLKYLQFNDHEIDHVLIALDLYPFFLPPDLNKPDFRHHPEVTGENTISFYLSYLFRTSFVYLATEMGYFYGEKPPIYSHNIESGSFTPDRTIKAISTNYEAYWEAESQKSVEGAKVFRNTQHKIDVNQKKDLIELVEWLNRNGITYQMFVNPRHSLNDDYYSNAEFIAFESALDSAKIDYLHRLPDMSCLLMDNKNFFDLMHYKQVISDAIIDSLYEPASSPTCFIQAQNKSEKTQTALD